MNLALFFVAWSLVFLAPIPPTRSRLHALPRLISIFIGWFFFFVFMAALTPLSLFVYWMIYLRSFLALVESAFQIARRKAGEEDTTLVFGRGSRRRRILKISTRVSGTIVVALLVFFFVFALAGVAFTQVQRVSNAYYFDNFIESEPGLPFRISLPDNQTRLVTQELAVSVARRHMSEFGSNVQVLDSHITKTLEGELVWVTVIGSTNVLAENYVKGFILIDAADPVALPQIVREEFAVGDGLWWDHNIIFRSYMADIAYSYGVSYPTWDPTINDLVYIVARYHVGFDLIRTYAGLIVYDSSGNVIETYTTLESVPQWATQVYDEDWMETMINEWGAFRRGDAFDYWAGGFLWIIPPSRERVHLSEDTRYIVDPETGDVVAMVMVHPVASERTLAGVFKATREGIFFYDYQLERYISGITTEDIVEGKLPKPAAGLYYAEMPLLYPVEVSSGTFRLAWYVPIYWREGTGASDETIYLAGFAIIDALDINTLAINIVGGGVSSEQLIRSTRLDFLNLFGAVTFVGLNASVVEKQEYVRDGLTHVVLRVDDVDYPWMEATPSDLPVQEWYELLSTKTNDLITAEIEKRGDTWAIISFDNLNIP